MTESQNGGRPRDRSALVLYGSETGNSQDAAEQLGRTTERLRFMTDVVEMDSIDLNMLLRYTVVIFTVSTTGQGDMPINSRKFWKSLLRKRLPPNCLSHVSFTIFGLGDSSYAKFNFASRKLLKRLEQLGAREFYPVGEGDEQHEEGIDGAFLPWSSDLKRSLLERYPLSEGVLPIPDDEFLTPRVFLELDRDTSDATKALSTTTIQHTPSSTHLSISTSDFSDHDIVQTSMISQPAGSAKSTTSEINIKMDGHMENGAQPRRLSPSNTPENAQIAPALRAPSPLSDTSVSPPPKAKVPSVQTPQRDEAQVEMFNGAENKKEANKCLKESVANSDLLVDCDEPPTEILDLPFSYIATITDNRRMTAQDHFQDVRFLSMTVPTYNIKNIDSNKITYQPGDVVTLYPKNFPSDVDNLIRLQNWGALADEPLHFVRKSTAHIDPLFHPQLRDWVTTKVCTLRSLLLHNLDITAIPRRIFFEQIAHFTTDSTQKERLREFSNPVYTDEFFDYATRPRRSILEILHDFHTVQIPFRFITTIFPHLRGRQFSIASGGHTRIPGQDRDETVRIELCIALVKYRTILRKVRQGVCSRWVNSLKAGTQIVITIQNGNYPSMDSLIHKPILMIAPGTGIAPMRSLYLERDMFKRSLESRGNSENETASTFGNAMLIFGNRNEDKDLLFREELTSPYIQSQIRIATAWSRDFPKGDRRNRYVQDVIRDMGDVVYSMLVARRGVVFVCGSSGKMPLGVRIAIRDVVKQHGRLTDEEAEEQVAAMEKGNRYIQETW